ncbi:MAG: hydantoinase/oxoprolinase family protein [Candidatus Aminicenantes bacterium]
MPYKHNLALVINIIRIGVDTGGTFTDFVIYSNGKIFIKKVPSTPEDPSEAIVKGVNNYLEKGESLQIIHGTTVATNSLLEKSGDPIALLTTQGFEDVIFIGRQTRNRLYDLKGETRIPLFPRSHCIGIRERTSVSGKILKKISKKDIKKAVEAVKKIQARAVAVCFINSYANADNEKKIHKAFDKEGYLVSRSSEILPEYREYERTVITAVNAYLMPVISRYLMNLENCLENVHLRIMQSNEGHISTQIAKKEPIRTALSGPAGGVVAAYYVAKSAGYHKIVTFDMGGTSSDVSLIDGKIQRTSENKIGEFPLRLPIIDINTVGAGGGSIAYMDKGGSLRVGPKSAGADPGPACYGKGKIPTVTDANLVVGRLSADHFLGGKMKIFPERSYAAIKNLGKKIGKSVPEAAAGIIKIANSNMSKAIRVISIEKGIDVRKFALFSFGGAGGMHAAEIALGLQIPVIIIPKNAGVLSSLGLLLADSTRDYSKSILKIFDTDSIGKDLNKEFNNLEIKAVSDMQKEGFAKQNILLKRFLDLRYYGQSFEITIPYAEDLNCVNKFHESHERLYLYSHPERPIEIVNIRLKATGKTEKVKLEKIRKEKADTEKAVVKKQKIYYQGKYEVSSVYDRSLLKPENKISGPALIVDLESTTFIPPDFRAKIDEYLNIIMSRKENMDD